MIIRVQTQLTSPPEKGHELVAILVVDNWNDWYAWRTMYSVFLYGKDGKRHDIGSVKLAAIDATGTEQAPYRPLEAGTQLAELPENFVSLGQDENYYVTLKELADAEREEYLASMRDCAFNVFHEAELQNSDAFSTSITRQINWSTIEGRYRRLANGNADLSKYKFTYRLPTKGKEAGYVELDFQVIPDSKPPTNVHVLIGRNAVGKTRTLNFMARALTVDAPPEQYGSFEFEKEKDISPFSFNETASSATFASVISVSFSAFDKFSPNFTIKKGVTYNYIGLKRSVEERLENDPSLFEIAALEQKTFEELAKEFVDSARECRIGRRQKRWRTSLEILESDPLFHELDIRGLSKKKGKTHISDKDFFLQLSSGHGIVLLIVTRLVELVEEQTLVLIDEPETHLHPPLLSAFVRAISRHMIDTNGVALLATHSPVALQEAPQRCCYKLIRHGNDLKVVRPDIETFGENVGTLTREVFGLEVTKSGFHNLLEKDASGPNADFDWIMSEYDEQIGSEGQALLRALIHQSKGD